ncbi:hypothetical protein ACOSP7_002766 [Xanthoceras sorbifolium]
MPQPLAMSSPPPRSTSSNPAKNKKVVEVEDRDREIHISYPAGASPISNPKSLLDDVDLFHFPEDAVKLK